MQPYFFPYIGYWQLMNAVDRYVIYDDVNFIKGGWINRNRILMGSEVKYFNLPMQGASPCKKINEVGVQPPGAVGEGQPGQAAPGLPQGPLLRAGHAPG